MSALALLAPLDARAQATTGGERFEAIIEIERAPGSEACPDKEAVFRSIQRLFPDHEFRQGRRDSAHATRAHVSIRPVPEGHEARLSLLPPAHGERVIREKDEECRGLADALALAFVMLVAPPESSAKSESADEAPKPGSPAAVSAAAPVANASEPSERAPERAPEPKRASEKSYRAGFGASLVGGVGVLSEPALGAGAQVELFHRLGWGLSLQGLRLWALPAEAEGGSVTLTLWGLLVGPCNRQPLSASSALEGCLRFGIGAQHAAVDGFAAAEPGNFPWQVLVPSLSYRHAAGPLSVFAQVGFVAQLRPQSFSVQQADGSGDTLPIATAPKFGVMTDLGLAFDTAPF